MFYKLRHKLMLSLILISVVSIIPTAYITLNALVENSKSQAEEFGEKSAEYNSEIIRIWLGEKSNALTGLSQKLRLAHSLYTRQHLMQLFSDSNPDFISIFYGLDDNTLIDAYGWVPDDSYDVISRPWYEKARYQDKSITTSVYSDANKKTNVTAIATPIRLDDMSGVLAANIDIHYLIELVQEISFGKSGFAALTDDNGEIITISESEQGSDIFNVLSDNRSSMLREGVQYITINSAEYIVASSIVEGFDWNLILISPMSDFLDSALVLRHKLIYWTSAILALIILVDLYLGYNFSKPIEGLMECISRIARGNFDQKIDIRSKDEIGHLVTELEKMRINLKKIFTSMRYQSDMLAMNTQSLSEHIEGMHIGTHRFMSMLSHDIKTPVTLIKGYSKAISLGITDPEKFNMYIDRIHYRSEQIEQIVEDILDHTYEVQDITVRKSSITCSDFAYLILSNAKQYVINQNRTFKMFIDFGALAELNNLEADLVKIQRIVNNILSNAIKYSSEDSTIELHIYEEDHKLVTVIQDYGSGIDPKELGKIFNMFYKAENSKKGYGLGLYIMKALVTAHDGEVILESEPNHGTRCGFALEIKDA